MSLLPDGRKVDGLKVAELKKELEIRGLGRSGAKKDLVARLTEHLNATENMEAEEFSNTTTGTTESHLEAQSSPKQDNHDLNESSIIESDAEATDLSTATVIFVQKEYPDAHIAGASKESAIPFDHPEVKTGVTGDHSSSLAVDSDVSMLEPGEMSASSAVTDAEPTAAVAVATTVDEGQQLQQRDITASDPPSSASESGTEARIGEAQSSRRRNLWGARGDATSASQADKYPNPLVSISTDTLEKMVPTLTVVDKKPPQVDVVPPGNGIDPAASDALSPVPAAAFRTEDSSPTKSADQSHQPSPRPRTLTTVEKPSEVTTLDSSSSDYAKEAGGLHSIPDEEVVVMDATIEGGLDIDSAPVGVSESQKAAVATLQEVDTRGHASVRSQDTRQVTRKRSIESTGRERKQSPVKRKGLKETKAIGYLIEQPERVEPCQVTTSAPCEFVHITCLVRPFTADQLRQTITSSYGQVVDLWLNRIKSASVVHFESKQAAINCREGLDGSRWPSINPRVLRCDFVSQEFFNWMKQYGDMADMTPPKHLLSGSLLTVDPAKEARKAEDDRIGAHAGGHTRKSDDLRQKLSHREGDSAPRVTRPGAPGDLSASADSQAKSEPSKMLDDLFRKTTTSPSIYWLALTEEEAQQRAAERAELAAKRGGTRATRSPFAAGGEPQLTTDTALAVDKQPLESEKKKKTDSDAVPGGSSLLPPPEKVSSGGRQLTGRDADDQKGEQLQRRDGSPFMANEKKSDSAGKPVHRSGGAARDDDRFSGSRRQKSSRTSSSPSPKRLSKRPRPYREASPRRRPGAGAGGGDYYSGIRRRSSPSRSRSGGGAGRYRGGGGGGRLDSSAEAYRRNRVSSPHANRSRR